MRTALVELEHRDRDIKPPNVLRVTVTTRVVDDEGRLQRVAELLADLLDSQITPEEVDQPCRR